MNAHEAILQAVQALLLQAPAIAGGNVVRGRQRPVEEGTDQFVALYFDGSNPERNTVFGHRIDWTTEIRWECHALGNATTSGDAAALALNAQVYARLWSDPSLGGLVWDMAAQPILAPEHDEMAEPLGYLSSSVTVRHRTGAYTLEALP